jgi:hypothetical protein
LIEGKQVPQPAYGGAPLLGDLLAGKLVDPAAREAFTYWANTTQVGQWLALPPKTPAPIVEAYRAAFRSAMRNPEFVEKLKRINADIIEMSAADTAALVARLAGTSNAAIAYMQGLQRKQGIRTAE